MKLTKITINDLFQLLHGKDANVKIEDVYLILKSDKVDDVKREYNLDQVEINGEFQPCVRICKDECCDIEQTLHKLVKYTKEIYIS